MDDRPIFLIGFMGSGKSTLGRALAERLGWDFLDTDSLVEKAAGCGIEEIFRNRGEAAFRSLESGVVQGFQGLSRTVVATGGGLFLDPVHRRTLKSLGRTVWLDVSFETCLSRLGTGAGRPLWRTGDRVGFRAFFERRRAAYALAEARLPVGAETADELVGRFLAVFI